MNRQQRKKLETARGEAITMRRIFSRISANCVYKVRDLGPDALAGVSEDWVIYLPPRLFEDDVSTTTLALILCHEFEHCLRGHLEGVSRREPHDARLDNIAQDMEINSQYIELYKREPILEGVVYASLIGMPDHLHWNTYRAHLPKAPPQPQDGHYGEDGDGLDECRRETVRRRTASDYVKGKYGRHPGDGKGYRQWADDILGKGKVPWNVVLRRAVRRSMVTTRGSRHRSWRRFSRITQSSGYQVLVPSSCDSVPTVDVVLDTSGSMGKEDIALALAEIRSIAKNSANSKLICVDAEAYEAQPLRGSGKVTLRGGGGTDMRIGLEAATASSVVLITDGFTPYPETKPDYDLIVLITTQEGLSSAPDYAKVICIGE